MKIRKALGTAVIVIVIAAVAFLVYAYVTICGGYHNPIC
jgi:hypothetical protein